MLASSGKAVPGVGDAKHGAKGSVVVAALPKLADGTYVVDWQVVSADSHPINGAFTFTVGAATGGNVAGLLKNDTNHGVGIAFGLTRALAFGSVLVLLGGIVFLRTVSGEAGDDPGVQGLLWVSWVIALVTALAGHRHASGVHDDPEHLGDVEHDRPARCHGHPLRTVLVDPCRPPPAGSARAAQPRQAPVAVGQRGRRGARGVPAGDLHVRRARARPGVGSWSARSRTWSTSDPRRYGSVVSPCSRRCSSAGSCRTTCP